MKSAGFFAAAIALAPAAIRAECAKDAYSAPPMLPSWDTAGCRSSLTGRGTMLHRFCQASGYGEGWYISPGWPGEYSAGLCRVDEGVHPARPGATEPAAPRDKACAAAPPRNYQLWNYPRVSADKLEFLRGHENSRSRSRRTLAVGIRQRCRSMQTLALKQGDQLQLTCASRRRLLPSWSFGGREYDNQRSRT